jgi:hypothetical protein
MNMGGLLLGYLAVFVLGGAILVALGLLLAGQGKIARFVSAGGFLLATLIMAVAALSFLEPEFRHDESAAFILVVAAILFLAGAGQFIAAFRGPGRYAAALACALGSLAIGTAVAVGGADVMLSHVPAGPVVSGLLAAASVVIAVLPSFGERHTEPPESTFDEPGADTR